MPEPQEWHLKHRPRTLDRVEGNAAAVAAVKAMFAADQIPHFLLLVGPKGSGKTTIARIIKNQLGCSDIDFREINSAMFRGIDDIRALQRNIRIAPAAGTCRVILMDECFPAGTPVAMADGSPLSIENIRVGDWVIGADGPAKVKRTFTNLVPLHRVCSVKTSEGQNLITTVDHLFLTKDGWVPARLLEGRCILSIGRYPVDHANIHMHLLQKGVPIEVEKEPKVLHKELCFPAEKRAERVREINHASVCVVRQAIHAPGFLPEDVLFAELRGEVPEQPARREGKTVQPRSGKKDIRNSQSIGRYTTGQGITGGEFYSHDLPQPVQTPGGARQNDGYQRGQRDPARLAGGTRGQWKDHPAAEEAVESIGQTPVAAGACRAYGQATTGVADQLQTGYRELEFEGGHRGRREGAQIEKEFIQRLQEDGGPREVGVESVTVFQRGNNGELFRSCITDRELLRGFVRFYDLEIDGHPSYTADGFVVHNCHRLTPESQDAALKVLEDTPPHVYFILCTTEPNKLIDTLRSRAKQIATANLSDDEARRLLERVCKKEGVTFTPAIINALVEGAEGCARVLMVNAQAVAITPEPEREAVAAASREMAAEGLDLCRALLAGKGWPEVARILAGLKGEPETVRRGVLGYCKTVLLKEGTGPKGMRAYLIMDCFSKNLFDTGAAGLVYQAFEATTAKE